jgi:hypothetical protein
MIAVVPFMRNFLAGGLLPKNISIGAVVGEEDPLVNFLGRFAGKPPAGSSAGLAGRLRLRLGNFFSGGRGSLDEDLIFPDDRRGGAESGNWRFPFHVLVFIPFKRGVCQGRHPIGCGTPPLRPIAEECFVCIRGAGGMQRAEQKEKSGDQRPSEKNRHLAHLAHDSFTDRAAGRRVTENVFWAGGI